VSRHYIKYPIAYNIETKGLVNISDVTSENKKDLICFECKEHFNCILNHDTPHFRHKPGSNCPGNVESYLHWLTKECFKLIKEIELPEIFISNLSQADQKELKNEIDVILEQNVPDNLIFDFRKNLKKSLSKSGKYQIQKVNTEEQFKSEIGTVQVDVVAMINDKNLFIEPHYTNPIHPEKLKKLELIGTPTLSITLLPFIQKFNSKYTVNDLCNYLVSNAGKYWTFNKKETVQKLIRNYLKYIKVEISKNQEHFNIHLAKIEKLRELENEVKVLQKKISPTEKKIWQLRKEMQDLKKEMGIIDYYDI